MTHEEEERLIASAYEKTEKAALRVMEWLLMVTIPTLVVKGIWLILHGEDMMFAYIGILFAAALLKPLKMLRNHDD